MNMVLVWLDGDSMSSWVLRWLLQALFFGTLLAGITWMLTVVLRRRIPAAVRAALWTLVLLKFLVPDGPHWSHSLASLCRTIPGPILQVEPPIGHAESILSPAPEPTEPTEVGRIAAKAAACPSRSWRESIVLIYVAAVAILAAARARAYLAFCARCRALPHADSVTRQLVGAVCRRLGVRRIPSTSISDEPAAPFVIGFVRPMLVLSHRHLVRPDELETVIVHEVAHLRRGDYLTRCIERIAGTVLFFWPVVGWVNRRIDAAREQACDEWALRHGRLTPSGYARCLLDAARAALPPGLAYHPACMATDPATIERRIEMILESPKRLPRHGPWGRLTLMSTLAWGLFALTGAAEMVRQSPVLTEESVKQRAAELYQRVVEHKAADVNADGRLSYTERDAYLVALAVHNAKAFMEEFPYVDRNHSGNLDLLEAFDAIKGVTLIAYADRRASAATSPALDWEFCHKALDAQAWLLDSMTAEPSVTDLDNIWSVINRVEGPPHGFSARMFNQGGPPADGAGKCCPPGEGGKFSELEGNIAAIEAKLTAATDPVEAARLQAMLDKVKEILRRLMETDNG